MITRSLPRQINHRLPVLILSRSVTLQSALNVAKPTTSTILSSPIRDAAPHQITLEGFVLSVRKQKRIAFAVLADGSTVEGVQVVLSPKQAEDLSYGTAVRVRGQWQKSPNGTEQNHELQAEDVKVLGSTETATYPLQKKFQTAEYLRTIPHLRSRIPFNSLLLRLRSQTIARVTAFFAARDFVQTHPPILTSSDCEGAGAVFTVAESGAEVRQRPRAPNEAGTSKESYFFRDPKYLTVSSQLHLEALAQSVGRVWTLSPTFRAERSDTARHLSEFYMLEAEMAFVEDLESIMSLVEGLVQDVARGLHESRLGKELLTAKRTGELGEEESVTQTGAILQRRWHGLMKGPWLRITYSDAIKRLAKAATDQEVTFTYTPDWGSGLHAEHERFLAEDVGQGSPVFVTDYPRAIKAFYMAPSDPKSTDPTCSEWLANDTAACFDLLLPDMCELAGGSMREHRLPELIRSMTDHGVLGPAARGAQIDVEGGFATAPGAGYSDAQLGPLKWYVDLRRWGSVPHGGFGLGFDRLLGYLAGVPNIREVVTFPRWVGRCDC